MFLVFFFKQKTAYEMRISDWSSDVCSSDPATVRPALPGPGSAGRTVAARSQNDCGRAGAGGYARDPHRWGYRAAAAHLARPASAAAPRAVDRPVSRVATSMILIIRSEEHPSALKSLLLISYAVF